MTPWTSLFQAERTAFTRMINTRIWHCRTSSVITTLPSFLNCMRNMFNTPWFQGWFLVPGTVLHFCFSEIWTPGVLKDNSKDPSDNIYKELLSLALHCSGVHAVFLTFFFLQILIAEPFGGKGKTRPPITKQEQSIALW